MQFSGYEEMKVSHEKLATPPLKERTRTFLRPINNCGQTKACLGTLYRVCLMKQSSLLPRQKKTFESSSNPFYVSFLSYELSVPYYLCCTYFTDSGTFYSLTICGVYMADSASGQDEPILSARVYLLCPARKDFVLITS